jgi:hypothetical protein
MNIDDNIPLLQSEPKQEIIQNIQNKSRFFIYIIYGLFTMALLIWLIINLQSLFQQIKKMPFYNNLFGPKFSDHFYERLMQEEN